MAQIDTFVLIKCEPLHNGSLPRTFARDIRYKVGLQGKASRKGGEHMKGSRLLLSLVLAAVVTLALAGAASAAKLDVADHKGPPFSTELTGGRTPHTA
jgi:hypothetical protein